MFTIDDIRPLLGRSDKVLGNQGHTFSKVSDSASVDEATLDWIHPRNQDPIRYLRESKANVIIAPRSAERYFATEDLMKTIVVCDNPMLLFSRVADRLFVVHPRPGVHESAIIHPEAEIGASASIGAFCVIGKVEIGSHAIIAAHVYIEDGVTIGDGVFIKAGARLGQAGFAFVKNDAAEFEKFPQLGSLRIESRVEIGSNTTIDKGSLSDTIIGEGTKISGLAVIAHNVSIGSNCFIGAGTFIAGSTRIGDNCWIAPSVSIREHLVIGDSSVLGLGSTVLTDVPPRQIWVGNPARLLRKNDK